MSRALVITLPLLLLLCGSREASAHRFAAGVLEVRGNRHDVLVTLSAPSAAFDALQIKLPARCRTHGKGQLRSHDKTRSSAQRYRCSGAGIVGATLRLDGLGSANVSVVARLDGSHAEQMRKYEEQLDRELRRSDET